MKAFAAFAATAAICGSALAQTTTGYGEWAHGQLNDKSGLFAGTANDSKGLFGQFCYKSNETCYWLLTNDVECRDEHKYPVLVNSDDIAANMELLCLKIGGATRYAFTDFDAIDSIARKATRIAIAFPMESGLFKVSRFSLNGATRTVDEMRAKFQVWIKKNPGTRDAQI